MMTSNITDSRPVNFQSPSEPITHDTGLNKIKKVALIALGTLALVIGAGLIVAGAMTGLLLPIVSGAALVITGIALLSIGRKSQQSAPRNTGIPSQPVTRNTYIPSQPVTRNTGIPSQPVTHSTYIPAQPISQLDEVLEQFDRERAAQLLSKHPEFLNVLSEEIQKVPDLFAGINEELSEDTLYKFLKFKTVAVAVTRNVEYYQFLPLHIRGDINVALLAVRKSTEASILIDIPLEAKEDIRVASEYVQKYPQGYGNLPLKSRQNADVSLLAIRGSNNANILDDIPLEAKENIRVASEYVQKYPQGYGSLPLKSRLNAQVALIAIRGSNNSSILNDIPLQAQQNIRVAREYVQKYPDKFDDLPYAARSALKSAF